MDSIAVAGAAAGVEVAALVIVISIVLAIVSSLGSGSSDSTQQELKTVLNALPGIGDETLNTYWNDKLGPISVLQDHLQTDLQWISSQGITGPQVKGYVNAFINDGANFVNALIPNIIIDASDLWQQPYVPSLAFTAQQVLYPAAVIEGTPPDAPITIGSIMGWYGSLPQTGSTSSAIPDPRSMLPVLAWGIGSYLTILRMANLIDPTQNTFPQFRTELQPELVQYTNLFQQEFAMAIDGLVISDLPSRVEIS